MYFNQLFSNFENSILNFIQNNDISPFESMENIPEAHYHQKVLNRADLRLSHFHVTTDPFIFIQHFFKLNDNVIHDFKEFFSLVDNFFQPSLKPYYRSNNNLVIVQNFPSQNDESQSHHNLPSINFLFGKADICLKLNSKNELLFRDLSGFFETTYVPVDPTDVSAAFLTVIEQFKQGMLKVSGLNTSLFDNEFVEKFKNISFEDMIRSRLKINKISKDFYYHSRDSLLDELKSFKDKYPTSDIRLCPNGIIFKSADVPLFLHSMKSMFSPYIYSNIAKAINFYHTYNVLMNKDYDIKIIIHIKDKLSCIDNIMIVNFDSISFDVALKNDPHQINCSIEKERTTLCEIYTENKNGEKIRIIKTHDLFELYEYVYKIYSPILSKTLDKPVDQMTLDDAKVLLMYNF